MDFKLLLVIASVALSVVAAGGLLNALMQALVWRRISLAGVRTAVFCLGLGAVDAGILIVVAVYPSASWLSLLIAMPVVAFGVLFLVLASRLRTDA